MINITLKTEGKVQAINNIGKLADQIGDHRDFLRREVEPELKKQFRKAFRTRGFGTWQPLKRSTLREKARRGYPSTPLVRTGRYRDATEQLLGRTLTRSYLEVRSPIPYARYLEYGTRHMFARSVFGVVGGEMERLLPRLYREYLRRTNRS